MAAPTIPTNNQYAARPDATVDWPRLVPTISAVAEDHGLSVRETQVLIGMDAGLNNAEIGHELYLAEDTVKTHARRLFHKLRVKNRTQAVSMAWRKAIFTPVDGDNELRHHLTKVRARRDQLREALKEIAARPCDYPDLRCRTWSINLPVSWCPSCRARAALDRVATA